MREVESEFLQQLMRRLRDSTTEVSIGDDETWFLTPENARLIADALEIALKIARGLPAELAQGQPQPCLGWQVACPECTYQPVRWSGIAFSEQGAHALLREHKGHSHR